LTDRIGIINHTKHQFNFDSVDNTAVPLNKRILLTITLPQLLKWDLEELKLGEIFFEPFGKLSILITRNSMGTLKGNEWYIRSKICQVVWSNFRSSHSQQVVIFVFSELKHTGQMSGKNKLIWEGFINLWLGSRKLAD